VGVVLLLFAVAGAVSLVSLLIQGVTRVIDNPKEKAMFEQYLRLVVMHDPDPFDDVQTAKNAAQLLDICMWSLLDDAQSAPTPQEFPTDDDGNVLIPQQKVENEFKKIFGENAAMPPHTTFDNADYEFSYDPKTKSYVVPATGALTIYVPRVRSIEKVGNSVKLLVDYLAYDAADWRFDENGVPQEPEPAKTMLITLFESNDGYTLGSIQTPQNLQAILEGTTRIAAK
jgi:hypothetical protein